MWEKGLKCYHVYGEKGISGGEIWFFIDYGEFKQIKCCDFFFFYILKSDVFLDLPSDNKGSACL